MKSFFSRYRSPILACLLTLLSLAGCGNDKDSPPAPESRLPQTLRIGLLPEQDIFVQKKRYTPIAEYLAKKTGVNIELKILRRYGNIVENFKNENLDGAFFGSFTGALAIKALDVEPLARPEYPNGVSTYQGIIFTHKNSGIKNIADMKGKIFVFVDKATTAGWLLPMHFFHQHGVTDYQAWFGETYFAGTHEDAIHDVLNGKADVGAAKDLIFHQLARGDSRIKDELEILEVSPKVPSNTLSLRKDIPGPFKAKVKELLLTMHKNPEGLKVLAEFGAVRFLETGKADYHTVFTYARDIGLDLADYNYHNR